MMSLHAMLGMCMMRLQAHPLCEHAEVLETKIFSADQFFFKIRATIKGSYQFQARLYVNHGHIDYAYQLFTDVPMLRWDNKEEFPHLATYPHHYHDEHGYVADSPLTGTPENDIEIVLQAISSYIAQKIIAEA